MPIISFAKVQRESSDLTLISHFNTGPTTLTISAGMDPVAAIAGHFLNDRSIDLLVVDQGGTVGLFEASALGPTRTPERPTTIPAASLDPLRRGFYGREADS